MNFCEDCHVYVDESLTHCPLCGKKLTDHPSGNNMYPSVSRKTQIDSRDLRMDGYFYLTFFIIAICAVLNVILWEGSLWFLAIAASLLYAWVLVRITIFSDWYVGAKALCQMAALFILFLALDFVTGFHGWSYEAVLPLILTGGLIYIDFYSYIHKSYWRDNLVYAILFLLLGFLPLIFYLAGLTQRVWPMVLSTLVSGLTVLGILKFTIKHLREELKKRLHF